MNFSPNDPSVSLIDQLFDVLAGETDTWLHGTLSVPMRLQIAIQHTDEARAAASAFIIASATDIAVECVGAEGVVKYLHDLDDELMVYDADEGAERRATLAWRDCVVDGDYDIATRSALYSVGDLADSAAGLAGALDSALWMVVNVLDPARDDFEMPMEALGLLFDVVEMARDWS